MRYIARLALIGVSVLGLAACGGSSSSSTSAGGDFTAKANAICTSVNSQIAALPAIKTIADAIKVGTHELAITGPAVTKLKALTPPAGKKAKYALWTANLDQSEAINTQLLAALKAGDQSKFTSLGNQSKALNTSGNQMAKTLGLPECSKDFQPGSGGSSSSST